MLTPNGLGVVNWLSVSGGFATFTLVLTLGDHSFSTYGKYSLKLTFRTP